jgi:hypothetical protein
MEWKYVRAFAAGVTAGFIGDLLMSAAISRQMGPEDIVMIVGTALAVVLFLWASSRNTSGES